MSWGVAVKELVEGFKSGYGFVEDIEDKRAAREQRDRALDLESERVNIAREGMELEAGWKEQDFGIRRDVLSQQQQEFEAGAPEREARVGLYGEQAEELELRNDKARRLKAIIDGTSRDYFARKRGLTSPSTTPGQQSAIPLDDSNLMSYAPESGYSTFGGDIPPEEQDLAIRMIAMEARGEPEEGKQAVANVILNRYRSGRYGDTLTDVITAPNQFEPWSTRRDELLSLDPDSPEYQNAAFALQQAMQGDITGGATHFLNPEVVRDRRGGSLPAWAQGEGLTIANHTFFAPEGRVADGSVGADNYAPALSFAPEEGVPTDAMGAVNAMAEGSPLDSGHEAAREGLIALAQNHGMDVDEAIPTEESARDTLEYATSDTEDTADPQDVEDMGEVVKASAEQYGEELSDAEVKFLTLKALYDAALLEGDYDSARQVAASVVANYRMAFRQYTAIAQAAVADGNLESGVDAMVRAYAFIPDGMDVQVEKRGDDFVVIQTDIETGQPAGEIILLNPDEMTQMIMGVDGSYFEDMVVDAASKREMAHPAVVEQYRGIGAQDDMTNEDIRMLPGYDGEGGEGGAGGFKWSDQEQIAEMVGAELDAAISAQLGDVGDEEKAAAYPPAHMNIISSVARSIARDGPTNEGPTDPGLAAHIIMDLTAVDEATAQPRAMPPLDEEGNPPLNEDGTVTWMYRRGPVVLTQDEDAMLRTVVMDRVRMADEENNPGLWDRVSGNIRGYLGGEHEGGAIPLPMPLPLPPVNIPLDGGG